MDLSIIIPTKLAHNHISDCLNGFIKFTRNIDYEIIIVVNKDFDGIMLQEEVKLLKKMIDANIKTFWPNKDLGIAGAINFGIDKASGEYILITNDDIELKEDLFIKYKAFFEKYPCIGSVGFKGNTSGFKPSGTPSKIHKHVVELIDDIRCYDNCTRIFDNEKYLNFIRSKNANTIKKIPSKVATYHERYWPYIAEVSFNHTCAIFSTKKLIERIGMFDEYYWPAGGEDLYFGFTLLSHGYRNIRVPIRHIHYGDIEGIAKSGGATSNLLKNKVMSKKIRDLRKVMQQPWDRARSQHNQLIKNFNRKNCIWEEDCQ